MKIGLSHNPMTMMKIQFIVALLVATIPSVAAGGIRGAPPSKGAATNALAPSDKEGKKEAGKAKTKEHAPPVPAAKGPEKKKKKEGPEGESIDTTAVDMEIKNMNYMEMTNKWQDPLNGQDPEVNPNDWMMG